MNILTKFHLPTMSKLETWTPTLNIRKCVTSHKITQA